MSFIPRRQFLKTATAGVSFGVAAPGVFAKTASQNLTTDRILVVIELAGGNDGLNTVIPHRHDAYKKARPTLAISQSDALSVNDELGFHPVMTGIHELLQDSSVAVVQGVGYDNPNRSHFESMDIWHTCQRKDETRTDGWLGRFIENSQTDEQDPRALHLGQEEQPFALMSRDVRVPSIRSLEQFRLKGGDGKSFRTAVRELADAKRSTSNSLLGFVQSSTASAMAASERMEQTGKSYRPAVEYSSSALGQKLQTVAKLIASDLQTSVYYVRLDGFDTHARQEGAHQSLLRQFSDSVLAFQKDLKKQGLDDRVLTFAFSEFGRRVAENASKGTDHGTAGPVFLVGSKVRAGLIGQHPDLDKLSEGDLEHHTDFRSVYASILSQWLQMAPQGIVPGDFPTLPLINAG